MARPVSDSSRNRVDQRHLPYQATLAGDHRIMDIIPISASAETLGRSGDAGLQSNITLSNI